VIAQVVERREQIPFRIPMRDRHYEAILVVLRAGGFTGLGEAPLTAGRPREAALRAADEAALLDLNARATGASVAELLGGAHRRGVFCNALITATRPADVAAEVERAAGLGFRAFKLKAANAGGSLDLERLGAARWAAGRGAELRLDFNGSLGMRQAEAVLGGLIAFAPITVEQPLPVSATGEQWTRLAALTGVPLAADESLTDPSFAPPGIGLAIKLATVGGPRAALARASAATGGAWVASSFETSIGLAAALHTAAAFTLDPGACGLATARLLEADLGSGLDLDDGFLRLPGGPGLGVELDPSALDRYRVDK
jgi:muconate cycloisomerase